MQRIAPSVEHLPLRRKVWCQVEMRRGNRPTEGAIRHAPNQHSPPPPPQGRKEEREERGETEEREETKEREDSDEVGDGDGGGADDNDDGGA